MILACTLGMGVSVIPISILSMGVFIKPMSASLGWGRGELSLALTILSLSMAVALPLAGRLIDKFGVRIPLVASLFLYGGGVAATPTVIGTTGLTGFYAIALWLGIMGAPSSTIGYIKIISGWFNRSRGLAMGFVMSGIAFGGAVGPMIAINLIESFGWEAGFYGLALLPLIVGNAVALVLREPPHMEHPASREGISGLSLAQALRTRVFWLLMVLLLVAATAIHGIQIHLAPLLSDSGLSPERAAMGVSFMFIVSLCTRLFAGYMFDRLFAPLVGATCFFCTAIGVGLLLATQSSGGLVISIALLGIGAGAESDLMGYLVSRYFGLKAFGAIFGWIFGALMVGSAIGPLLLGAGHDMFGSYAPSLVWCAVGLVAGTVILASLPGFPQFANQSNNNVDAADHPAVPH